MPNQVYELEQTLVKILDELNTAKVQITRLKTRLEMAERLASAGSFEMNGDTMQVQWSKNLMNIFGTTQDVFFETYKDITTFIHPNDRTSFQETMVRARETHNPYSHTHRIVRPDGEVRHVRETGIMVEGDENTFFGIIQDITDQIETAPLKTDLQDMTDLAGDLVNIGGWKLRFESRDVEVTPTTASFYGAPDQRILPLSHVLSVHSDDSSKRLKDIIARTAQTSEDFDEVFTLAYEHNQERTVRMIGHIEKDEFSGQPIGLKGAIKDITALTQAQQKANDLTNFARLAERLAHVGGWHIDLERGNVEWSAEVAHIHDEPVNTSPALDTAISYYVPEHRDRIRAAVEACIEHARPFDEVLQAITAKGRRIWVHAIGEAVRNASGRIVAIQGAFQDISDVVTARETSNALATRLQLTLESISDAFFLLDFDWRFSFLNKQSEILLHRNRDDLLGKSVWDEFPEAVGSQFQKEYERAVAEATAVRFQEFFNPLQSWFEVNAYPTAEGLAVYFRDVTQQRARDEHLRLLEGAVSRQNDILIITEAIPKNSPEGLKIIYVNDAFTRRTGFTREEAVGQTPHMLHGPKTQRAELDRMRYAMANGQPVRAELINYTKSGEEYWIELDISPLYDTDGHVQHFVAIERDITARRNADEALRISEERFRLISEATGNVVWEWDIRNGKNWWSDGLKVIFGHEPNAEIPMQTLWNQHIHPDDQDRINTALKRLHSGQINMFNEKYRFRRANGTWASVDERAFSIRDSDEKVVRLLGSITDISEQVELEDRLRQAQKMEAVGQLTGGVAHDFNNLLTIVLGNAEILSDTLAETPSLQALAETISDAADRGAALTSRLLAFSRKQVLAPCVTDVSHLIQGMESLLRRTLPGCIKIKIICEDGLWKTEVDPGQLEAALLNLTLNARDAMPDGGALTIETVNTVLDDDYAASEFDVAAGQYILIVVTDTGTGIGRDVISHIFDPFFTTKEVGMGSGLGLSMVYGFIKQSGGHIRVYSEPGEGTSFKLYLPRSHAQMKEALISQEDQRIIGGSETILVVEDERSLREHVTLQLEALGYRVYNASFGAEALEILNKHPEIDLLFTDIVMPGGMNGRILANKARVIQPDLKVLYTSGYTENSLMHNGNQEPGIELLTKPYRRVQLALRIRKILDQN